MYLFELSLEFLPIELIDHLLNNDALEERYHQCRDMSCSERRFATLALIDIANLWYEN